MNLTNVKPFGTNENSIMDLLRLYQYKGKDYYYDNLLKNDLEAIVRKTVKTEILSIAKALKLDVTDARKKYLIKNNGEPKNSDETMFLNIKNVLTRFVGNYKSFELESNEFLMLSKTLYANLETIKYKTYSKKSGTVGFLEQTKLISQREVIDEMIKEFKLHLASGKYEVTNLIANFYIDFINQDIFNNHNDVIAIFILYMLIFVSGFTLFKFTSFFTLFMNHKEEFNSAVLKANMNYSEGYSDTRMLNELIIKILLEGYEQVDEFVNTYSFDGKNSKESNIIGIIYHLPQEFTKDDIRAKDPLTSDSTINRALAKLQKEKKIRAMGTGRTAKWIRIVQQPDFGDIHQINLFEYDDEE